MCIKQLCNRGPNGLPGPLCPRARAPPVFKEGVKGLGINRTKMAEGSTAIIYSRLDNEKPFTESNKPEHLSLSLPRCVH